MAIEVWPYWWPNQIQDGAAVSIGYRTQEIQFGNGYGQNISDGPNPETKQQAFSFTGQTNDKHTNPKDVYAFLRRHFVTPFRFTTTDGETGLYIVDATSLTYTPQGRLTATVSATFKTAVGFVNGA